MEAYYIRNWEQHFESFESRRCKTLTWVRVPINHDTLGFRTIAEEPNGAELYAAMHLMVGVAAKTPYPWRGWLVRHGGDQGWRPLSARDLGRITSFPADLFERALARLEAHDVHWIGRATFPGDPLTDAGVPADQTGVPASVAGETGSPQPMRACPQIKRACPHPSETPNGTDAGVPASVSCGGASAGVPADQTGVPADQTGVPASVGGARSVKRRGEERSLIIAPRGAKNKLLNPSSGKNSAAAVHASRLRYAALAALEKKHPGHEPSATAVEREDLRTIQASLRQVQADQAAGKFD